MRLYFEIKYLPHLQKSGLCLYFKFKMAAKFIENKVIERFKNQQSFTREELLEFYHFYEPNINDGTFGWKIYDLKKKGIIESIKTGIYVIASKKKFRPQPEPIIITINTILEESFAHHVSNIWSTTWLNEFIELQTTSALIILEVDKESMEQIFYILKDRQMKVYLKPDENMIEKYISEEKEAIIVKPMITRAPTTSVKAIKIPTLEKILVDLFCDEKIFYAYQGRQLTRIYEAAFEKYIINLSSLLNYAKRRKRESALREFLLNNLPNKLKPFIE